MNGGNCECEFSDSVVPRMFSDGEQESCKKILGVMLCKHRY